MDEFLIDSFRIGLNIVGVCLLEEVKETGPLDIESSYRTVGLCAFFSIGISGVGLTLVDFLPNSLTHSEEDVSDRGLACHVSINVFT
jgi:hypothetical protein